ncbi:hypothetical protein VNI00_004257 [Paramarasmius palmivorus]|uniref:F-box domain-containing protein n=1 Tax=Paramarasmius palmivorus TaxID=297713 RepID=A0AAW0DMH1_9AGAR
MQQGIQLETLLTIFNVVRSWWYKKTKKRTVGSLRMPENASSRLPHEVLDTILENLRQDSQSLRQCALAARCLLPVAQRVIFCTVYLAENEPNSSDVDMMARFHRLLDLSPHLAKYVTEATILLHPTEWTDNLSEHPLSLIIPQLHSLRWLSFNFGNTINPMTFHQLHTLLGGSSIPRIRSLRTNFLYVASMGDLARICDWLAEGGDLQELQFEHVDISDTTSPVNTGYHSRSATAAQLKKLTISHRLKDIDSFLEWAISSESCLRFDELRELTVGDLTDQSSEHLLRILHTARSSIRQITFDTKVPSLSSIAFESFSALRSIAYHVIVPEESSLREWTNILAQHKELSLDSFIVNVNTYRRRADDPWTGLLNQPWKELEAAFMINTKRKKLEMRLGFSPTKVDIGMIEECFPLSHTPSHVARERLVVKQSIIFVEANMVKEQQWEYKPGYLEWKNTSEQEAPLPSGVSS